QAELDQNGSPTPGSGNLVNNVTASANEASDTDTLSIPITQSASMTVAKSSTTSSLSAPGPVNYSYLVTNTGNVTLTGVSLVDDNVDAPEIGRATRREGVGASETCTATHTITQAELDQNGSPTPGSGNLVNNVTASANEVSDSGTLYTPIKWDCSLDVCSSAPTSSLSAPGPVNYSYLVTNTGNVTLTGVSLVDDNVDAP